MTRYAAAQIDQRDYLELLREPDTSVVVFRRVGWTPQQYQRWSDRLLLANFAFVVPDHARGRDGHPVRDRQPEHQRGGHLDDPGHDGVRRRGATFDRGSNDIGVVHRLPWWAWTPRRPIDTLPPTLAHGAAGRALRPACRERDTEILAFERQWWKYAGAKEQAIRELFDMSATRYYQVLNALIDRQDALELDPMLVKRLRRMRASRQRARSARRLGMKV